jgi:hypothetical protein
MDRQSPRKGSKPQPHVAIEGTVMYVGREEVVFSEECPENSRRKRGRRLMFCITMPGVAAPSRPGPGRTSTTFAVSQAEDFHSNTLTHSRRMHQPRFSHMGA